MADEFIRIEVQNLDKLQRAIEKFPRAAGKYMQGAGKEAASRVILPTEGLKKYPPATAANAPPVPYYIRGRGMQYANRNDGRSERFGTQWYVKAADKFSTEIGNRASYSQHLSGDNQAGHMAPKGWRKLTEVVGEKMTAITAVYNAWIDKLLKDVGLK
jgi:hypothetical protein